MEIKSREHSWLPASGIQTMNRSMAVKHFFCLGLLIAGPHAQHMPSSASAARKIFILAIGELGRWLPLSETCCSKITKQHFMHPLYRRRLETLYDCNNNPNMPLCATSSVMNSANICLKLVHLDCIGVGLLRRSAVSNLPRTINASGVAYPR